MSGLGVTTIYRLLDDAGIKRRTSGRRRLTPKAEAKVLQRYRDGETYQQIADDVGCSTHLVARLAHIAGVARKSGGMRPGILSAEQRLAISLRNRGSKSSQWKGGRTVDGSGYVLVRVYEDDPIGWAMKQKHNAYVREHRLVMARDLGRPLTANETVHHKNGDKQDNRLKNLELRVGRHGRGATHAHCSTCTCFAH